MSTQPTPTPQRSSAAKAMGTVGGILAAVVLMTGAGLLAVHFTQRDGGDHYYRTGDTALVSPGHAVTSEGVGVDDVDTGVGMGTVEDVVGRVRFEASSTSGKPIFVGIGPKQEVDDYLAGVGRTQITDVDDDGIDTKETAGHAPATTPAAQTFWTASAQTSSATHVDWKIDQGDWRLVVMNADGSAHVASSMNMGIKTDLLLWIGLGLGSFGLAGVAGTAFVVTRRR